MRTKLEVALSRRRWRAADAEIVLSALSQSGCTVSEFARRHGLRRKRLEQWRDRVSCPDVPAEPCTRPVDVPLLPVQVVGQPPADSVLRVSAPAELRPLDVSVGHGVIHVPHDFDEVHLHRVVGVLAATC